MSSDSAPASKRSLLLHVFRVEEGLGNAVLLQFPDGSFSIVDWGTERDEPLQEVLKLTSTSRIRVIAATHAHADHTLGLVRLMRACRREGIPVERLVYPVSTLNMENAYLTEARKEAKALAIPMSHVAVDLLKVPRGLQEPPIIAADVGWEMRALAPSTAQVANSELSALQQGRVAGNETSLVLLFRFTGADEGAGLGRALLPGDATAGTLGVARDVARAFTPLRLDNEAFVLPHHGSERNLPNWVDPLLHGVVVVSCPSGSEFHPSKVVLQRLSKRRRRGPDGLYCTSYALACEAAFGTNAPPKLRHLGRPGPCFEHIVVRVPEGSPAELVSTSRPGHHRRSFGWCSRS